MTTSKDGAASFVMRGGPKLNGSSVISPGVTDFSQWDAGDQKRSKAPSPGAPALTTLENAEPFGPATEWFAPPPEVRGTLIYGVRESNQDQIKFMARSLGTASTQSDRVVMDVSSLNKGLSAIDIKNDARRSAYNMRVSPDGRRALFHVTRPGQYLDNCHDLYVADLQTGKYELVQEYLFGESERWSPDSNKVAFVSGSLDTIFGDPVAPGLTVYIHDLATKKQNALLTNDALQRDDLAWTSRGDLLFSVQPTLYENYTSRPLPPVTYKAPANGYKPSSFISDGSGLHPSPDGKWVAFFGMEDVGRRYSTTQIALSLVRADGSERRALNREPGGLPNVFWTPDSKSLITFKYVNDADAPPLIEVRRWNVRSGQFRLLARLKPQSLPTKKPGEYSQNTFTPQQISQDGKYLFFIHTQLQDNPGNSYLRSTSIFHALDLQTGELHKLAIIRGSDFDWHDESGR